jgi:hypothetical protein
MRTREPRRQAILDQLGAIAVPERRQPMAEADIYRRLSARLTDWQGALERQPQRAREILQGLLVGRLVLAPKMIDGQRWFEYRGEATYGALPHGLVSVNGVVPPEKFGGFRTPRLTGEFVAA